MHGLIIRSFEGFVRHTYGAGLWTEVVAEADTGIDRFEPMFHYDDALAFRLVDLICRRLGKPRDAMLEDFGTYLVAHPAAQRVRRLLRFGGVDYEDFLGSLDDLAGRARLAVPDLDLPRMALTDLGAGVFQLDVAARFAGAGPVCIGLLRALADDYGALVVIEPDGAVRDGARLTIRLLKADYARAKGFDLAGPTSDDTCGAGV